MAFFKYSVWVSGDSSILYRECICVDESVKPSGSGRTYPAGYQRTFGWQAGRTGSWRGLPSSEETAASRESAVSLHLSRFTEHSLHTEESWTGGKNLSLGPCNYRYPLAGRLLTLRPTSHNTLPREEAGLEDRCEADGPKAVVPKARAPLCSSFMDTPKRLPSQAVVNWSL